VTFGQVSAYRIDWFDFFFRGLRSCSSAFACSSRPVPRLLCVCCTLSHIYTPRSTYIWCLHRSGTVEYRMHIDTWCSSYVAVIEWNFHLTDGKKIWEQVGFRFRGVKNNQNGQGCKMAIWTYTTRTQSIISSQHQIISDNDVSVPLESYCASQEAADWNLLPNHLVYSGKLGLSALHPFVRTKTSSVHRGRQIYTSHQWVLQSLDQNCGTQWSHTSTWLCRHSGIRWIVGFASLSGLVAPLGLLYLVRKDQVAMQAVKADRPMRNILDCDLLDTNHDRTPCMFTTLVLVHGVVLFVASVALSLKACRRQRLRVTTWTLATSSSSRFLSHLELGDLRVSIWWTYWRQYSNRARSYSNANVPANRTVSLCPSTVTHTTSKQEQPLMDWDAQFVSS
jgi:hypothetical protein